MEHALTVSYRVYYHANFTVYSKRERVVTMFFTSLCYENNLDKESLPMTHFYTKLKILECFFLFKIIFAMLEKYVLYT
jgi:hypothetical protein